MKNLDENIPHCLTNLIPEHIPVQLFSFKAGTFLFEENLPVKGVFYICSGKIQLQKKSRTNVNQLLALISADEWMGISEALFEKYYTNSAKALTDVKSFFISLEDFDKMLPENPALAKKLLQNLNNRLNKLDYMHSV